MLLAFGMLAAILHAQKRAGRAGDHCAMVDGSALLASMIWSFVAQGACRPTRQQYAGYGAHFYDTYACADGGHIRSAH